MIVQVLLLSSLLLVDADRGSWIEDSLVGQGRLLVYVPRGHSRGEQLPLLIALHGWGHKPEDFRDKSVIAELADRYGVVLACPDLGKSVYESAFYPESQGAWGKMPGLTWVGEVILPILRERYRVGLDPARTAVFGYSTGGRGAVLLAGRYPAFDFCASLSGTYDLDLLSPAEGEYRIHAKIFGERSRFPERWRQEDIVDSKCGAALGRVRIYLAHGAQDTVVKPGQLESMRRFLSGFHRNFEVVLDPDGKHDWAFWNAHLPEVFRAMSESGP